MADILTDADIAKLDAAPKPLTDADIAKHDSVHRYTPAEVQQHFSNYKPTQGPTTPPPGYGSIPDAVQTLKAEAAVRPDLAKQNFASSVWSAAKAPWHAANNLDTITPQDVAEGASSPALKAISGNYGGAIGDLLGGYLVGKLGGDRGPGFKSTGPVLKGAMEGAASTPGWKPGATIGSAVGYAAHGPTGAAWGGAIGGGLPMARGAIRGGIEAYRRIPPDLPPQPRPAPIQGPPMPPVPSQRQAQAQGSTRTVYPQAPPPVPPRAPVWQDMPQPEVTAPEAAQPITVHDTPSGRRVPTAEDRLARINTKVESKPEAVKPAEVKPNGKPDADAAARAFAESQGAEPGKPLVIKGSDTLGEQQGVEIGRNRKVTNAMERLRGNGVTPQSWKSLTSQERTSATAYINKLEGYSKESKSQILSALEGQKYGGVTVPDEPVHFATGGLVVPDEPGNRESQDWSKFKFNRVFTSPATDHLARHIAKSSGSTLSKRTRQLSADNRTFLNFVKTELSTYDPKESVAWVMPKSNADVLSQWVANGARNNLDLGSKKAHTSGLQRLTKLNGRVALDDGRGPGVYIIQGT